MIIIIGPDVSPTFPRWKKKRRTKSPVCKKKGKKEATLGVGAKLGPPPRPETDSAKKGERRAEERRSGGADGERRVEISANFFSSSAGTWERENKEWAKFARCAEGTLRGTSVPFPNDFLLPGDQIFIAFVRFHEVVLPPLFRRSR